MNHFQMLVLIAVFRLDWNIFVIEIFDFLAPISNSPTQLFSFECFLDERSNRKKLTIDEGGTSENIPRLFYKRLLLYGSSNPILVVCSILIWILLNSRNKIEYLKDKLIATIVVLIYISHGSVTKFMMEALK